MAKAGGQDPLFAETGQILALRIGIVSGMTIYNYPGIIQTSAGSVYVTRQTLDLTTHIPATADKAAWVLITFNASGTITGTKGSEFTLSSATDENDYLSHLPAAPVGAAFLAAAVRVYTDQTEVQETRTNTDIIDLRLPGRVLPASLSLALDDLSDVDAVTGLATGKPLTYNGSLWTPGNLILPAANILTLTNAAASTLALNITSGKTLTLTSADNYALTVPASGTAALLATANIFTADQTINTNSLNALLIEQDGVKDNVLVVDTTNGRIGIGKASPESNLHVMQSGTSATNQITCYGDGTVEPTSIYERAETKRRPSGISLPSRLRQSLGRACNCSRLDQWLCLALTRSS